MPMMTLLPKGLAAPVCRSKSTCVPSYSLAGLACLADNSLYRASKAMNATPPLATLQWVTINPPTPCPRRLLCSTFGTKTAGGTMLTPRANILCPTMRFAIRYRRVNRTAADANRNLRSRRIGLTFSITHFVSHSTESCIELRFQTRCRMSST